MNDDRDPLAWPRPGDRLYKTMAEFDRDWAPGAALVDRRGRVVIRRVDPSDTTPVEWAPSPARPWPPEPR
jgi:hypothetical protein